MRVEELAVENNTRPPTNLSSNKQLKTTMMMRNALLIFLASASLSENVLGFTSCGPMSSRQTSPSSVVLRLSPEEERAAVLSNYLAKAHEEKLRAVRSAEEKKDEEIKRLKEMLKERPETAQVVEAAPANTPTAALTISEPTLDPNLAVMPQEYLVSLVQKYKHFVANYVADAQQQKAEAVKAAEEALTKKYEARLQALSDGAAPEPTETPKAKDPKVVAPKVEPPAASAAPAAIKSTDLYAKRNARVEAAAAAGKSRWGSMEIGRVASKNAESPASAVEAADHGLRNDGGVGGPTLAERVAMGAAAQDASNSEPSVPSSEPSVPSLDIRSLYTKRNARVVASAKVGKSRWGEMELEKIRGTAENLNDAEIAAADHGLRADGGVSGPSLAERVNLGAMLLSNN